MLKAKAFQAVPIILLLILPFFLLGCGDSSPATASVSYQPPFLPVAFEIDTNGNISIKGDLSIVTPIGTFSVGADASTSLQSPQDVLVLIIRHVKNGSVVDDVYDIQTGSDEVKVVTNGRTTVDVTLHKVFIDATNGSIQSIEVTDANSASTNQQSVPGSAIPRLNSSYSGTLALNTFIGDKPTYQMIWNVNSQDEQGNINVTIIIPGLGIFGPQRWVCTGTINSLGHIALSCRRVDEGGGGDTSQFFDGTLYADGHIEGTDNEGTGGQVTLK